jgi:hypothetical protein
MTALLPMSMRNGCVARPESAKGVERCILAQTTPFADSGRATPATQKSRVDKAVVAIGSGRSILAATLLAAIVWTAARGEEKAPPKRAMPPKWSRDVLDTFFPDARTELQGERPDYAALAKGRSAADGASGPLASAGPQDGAGGFRWSALIGAETLEDEVKRLASQLSEHIATPSEFKGGTYQAARRDLSLVAVLFAVMGEYDEAVRWKDEAAAYRDLFARAGFNCKVGTDQTFREAQLRSEDLQSIIRGSRVEGPDAERKAIWPQTADRAPLMSRMEAAYDGRLSKWLATSGEFRGNLADVRHEAEILAALAEVISREGYEFAGDAEYAAFAGQIREGARAIADAATSEDHQRAEEAAADIGTACADCHDAYRS